MRYEILVLLKHKAAYQGDTRPSALRARPRKQESKDQRLPALWRRISSSRRDSTFPRNAPARTPITRTKPRPWNANRGQGPGAATWHALGTGAVVRTPWDASKGVLTRQVWDVTADAVRNGHCSNPVVQSDTQTPNTGRDLRKIPGYVQTLPRAPGVTLSAPFSPGSCSRSGLFLESLALCKWLVQLLESRRGKPFLPCSSREREFLGPKTSIKMIHKNNSHHKLVESSAHPLQDKIKKVMRAQI